ncbi:hypothetical protein D3C85_844160 [compost metagenome]
MGDGAEGVAAFVSATPEQTRQQRIDAELAGTRQQQGREGHKVDQRQFEVAVTLVADGIALGEFTQGVPVGGPMHRSGCDEGHHHQA